DNLIAWCTAADCSGGACGGGLAHYVVGLPADNIGSLGNVTGTYSLMGGTPITDWSSDAVIGTLNSATLTYDIGFNSGSIDMNMTILGRNWSPDGSVFGCGGSFNLCGGEFLQDSSYINVYGNGFFAGTNAE